jgi:ubiquinone/menaquinone biosynthesis C-methylase UbiE
MTSTSQLLASIDEISRTPNQDWLRDLEPRKLAEIDFHNKDRDNRDKAAGSDQYQSDTPNRKYYSITSRSRDYVSKWIEQEAPGRIFLDYACGNAGNAFKAARAGAAISLGFDISDVTVRNCTERAVEFGLVDKTRFFHADAENTKLPDNSIDRIICSGMLHHLDLSYAFPELRRILKPGGKILAVEALNYNPAIKLYRRLTPEMRTEWEKEHILSLKDLRFARRFFDVQNVRYWHVIGYAGALVRPLAGALDAADRVFESIPFLNRLAWTFTFELVKV